MGRQQRGVPGPSARHFGGSVAEDAGAVWPATWRASGGGILQREVARSTIPRFLLPSQRRLLAAVFCLNFSLRLNVYLRCNEAFLTVFCWLASRAL